MNIIKKYIRYIQESDSLDNQLDEIYDSEGKIIFVTGNSGSGKTTAAERIAKKKKYELISLDKLTKDELLKKYTREEWDKLDKKESQSIWQTLTTKVAKDALKKLHGTKYVVEGAQLVFTKDYKLYNDNIVVYVHIPKDLAIKRRVKREIEKKEKRIGRKLTNEEKKRKQKESVDIINDLSKRFVEFLKKVDVYTVSNINTLSEATSDFQVGDTILVGRWKNSPAIVKGFGKDKHRQPTVRTNKGAYNLYRFRIDKLMPKKKAKKDEDSK